jgi:hypothetical protein
MTQGVSVMIIGQIARILSEIEIIINVGKSQGVKRGIEFVIFSEGDHVTDPETGEDLGPIETVKGRVKVTHVMDSMSRAKTLTYLAGGSVSLQAAISSGLLSGTETRRRRLQVERSQVEPIREDLTVQVGDNVRSTE